MKNYAKLWSAMVLSTVLMTAWTVPTIAGLTTYSDRATFLAAAGGGLALADFEAVSNQSFQTLSSGVDASIPVGATFSSNSGTFNDLYVAPALFNGNTAIATASLFANFFGTPLIADFSPMVTAIGADVIPFTFSNDTGTITISVRDQGGTVTDFSVTPPTGSSSFFGVIGSAGTSIDRIVYTPPGGYTAGIDNFVFGQATAVPEPSTLLTLCTAVPLATGLAWLRRRKRTA